MTKPLVVLIVALMHFASCNLLAQIKTGDTLHISIKGVPMDDKGLIDGKYRVGESGKIKIPITGDMIVVNGLTNEQVSRKIEAAYKDSKIYQEPVIEVLNMVKDDPKVQALTVGGQVKRPGAVEWRKGMTLQQAIQLAGDRTPFASKYVFLTRNGEKNTYNTKLLEHQNIEVKAGDTVEVKQKPP